jgi:hypothetical protein
VTCNALEVGRRFGRPCQLHIQSQKRNQARNQHGAGSKKPLLCLQFFFLIFGLFLRIVLVHLGYKLKLQNFVSVFGVDILFISFSFEES